jgi:hypothetical protein
MKRLPQSGRKLYFPDLFESVANRAIPPHDYRIRWVTSRCRVSVATAETIVANVDFFDGEHR